MHRHIGIKKGVYKHAESSQRRLKEGEQVVQDLLSCIFRILQSAIPASDKLDLKSTYTDGEVKLIKFLQERVFTKVK